MSDKGGPLINPTGANAGPMPTLTRLLLVLRSARRSAAPLALAGRGRRAAEQQLRLRREWRR